MRITLVGSTRFEKEFKQWNKRLTLNGHVVYSLSVYPSDEGEKNWYTTKQKEMLDEMHLRKIDNSEAIFIVCPDGYVGESTTNEIYYANHMGKEIFSSADIRKMGIKAKRPSKIY